VPGSAVGVVSADVSVRDVVADAFARAVRERGSVDVLVCSAGVSRPGRLVALDDVFRSMIDIDLFGTVLPIRTVVPEMVRRRRGSVVGICSAAGPVGV
jgi:NAD(P)-dependent dehydrogenase (short-subunit alcohol dehydrogenase family)